MEHQPITPDARPPYAAIPPGAMILPGHPGYDDARRVWNGMIDRRPAMIVRCRSTSEVREALDLARARRLPIAVRGGGHNAAGLSVCDDGLVIDLSPMRGIIVDPDARIARVEGGATWAEVDAATQAHGLATTGGVVSSTGVGGLTLGGGIGWLMRRQGLACDNVIAFEVVTADGRLVRASETEHPDLFWGLRGGGGNFGIVTAFTFRVQPLGPVMSGMLVHPLTRAREVLRFYRALTAGAPDELTVFAAIMTSPDGAPILAVVPTWTGPTQAADAVLRPLREFGPPLADSVQPMPYVELQRMLDEGFPAGLQVYWRGEFVRALDDALIDELVDRFARVTSPLSTIIIEQLGGAVARVSPDATAFPHREAAYNLAMAARWTDPAEREVHVRWTRELHDAVRPFSSGGAYVNYLGVEEGADRVREAFGAAHWARLVALKDVWDPTNVFRFNQNILPSG